MRIKNSHGFFVISIFNSRIFCIFMYQIKKIQPLNSLHIAVKGIYNQFNGYLA